MNTRSKLLTIFLGVLLLVGLAAGPASAQKQRVVYGASAGDIGTLDPTRGWVSVESTTLTVVHEGLVRYPLGKVTAEVEPSLAESWDVSGDGKVFTFHLRKGVQFHEGFGEFTAEDVKFTLDRYRNPDISAWVEDYANIKNVEVVDRHTVRIELIGPDPFFLTTVTGTPTAGGGMLSKKAFAQRGDDAMRLHPIGTGPFMFKEYVPRDHLTMVRNDKYWRGKPILEEVVIRFMPSTTARELAMRTGEIDAMRPAIDAKLLRRLEKQGFIIDVYGPEIHWWLHLNTAQPPLDDIRVRKAIAYAINPKDLQAFLGPVAFNSDALYAPSHFGAASKEEIPPQCRFEYNPEKARQYLKAAGYPNGFDLSMIITSRDDYRQQLVLVQQHLKRVGINLKLNLVDHAHYHSQIVLKENDNPLIAFGEIGFPNTEIYQNRFFRSNAFKNFSRYNNPQFDALLDKVARTSDLNVRKELLKQSQAMVACAFVLRPTNWSGQPLVRHPRVELGFKIETATTLGYRFLEKARITNAKLKPK